jgi:N-methylhydantoinase B
VLNTDFSVDETATKALRDAIAGEREDPALFDFGGSIAEIKARCKEETGFEPPRDPVFQTWVTVGQHGTATRYVQESGGAASRS